MTHSKHETPADAHPPPRRSARLTAAANQPPATVDDTRLIDAMAGRSQALNRPRPQRASRLASHLVPHPVNLGDS